jgi:hypothetical protein
METNMKNFLVTPENPEGVYVDLTPAEQAEYEEREKQHLLDLEERKSQEYSRLRRQEYPAIGDQLDMIFHAGLGGDEFQAAIQAVKDANPKP